MEIKGESLGKAQLSEALRRIRVYDGLKEIRVCTNSNFIAPKIMKAWVLLCTTKMKTTAERSFREIICIIRLNWNNTQTC